MARREHSTHELLRKLSIKGYFSSEIKQVLEALSNDGYFSQTRFIEDYIRYRKRKGYGPLRIRQELRERGILEDEIDHHLNMTDNEWLANAYAAWQKRFKGVMPEDIKARAQQIRFLQYRGYTLEQIETIYNNKR